MGGREKSRRAGEEEEGWEEGDEGKGRVCVFVVFVSLYDGGDKGGGVGGERGWQRLERREKGRIRKEGDNVSNVNLKYKMQRDRQGFNKLIMVMWTLP